MWMRMPVNMKSILNSGKNHGMKQWRSKSVCRHPHPPTHIKKTLKRIKYTIYYYGKEYICIYIKKSNEMLYITLFQK